MPDIPERQCLIDFYEDPDGFYWHHRVLLLPTPTAGRWVISTPDFEVQIADLNEHRVVALSAGGNFPARFQGEIYAFDDPIPAADLERIRREARELLNIIGVVGGPGAAPTTGEWRIADTASVMFGEVVPSAVTGDADNFQQAPDEVHAHARVDSEWVACEKVDRDALEGWLQRKRAGPGRDKRIVGDIRVGNNSSANRFASFKETYDLCTEEKIEGWPFKTTPRAAREYMMAMTLSGLEWMTHHLDFVNKSGLSKWSGTGRAHRRVCEALVHFQCYDQVNMFSSAGVEFLIRFLIQIETAVKRNPRAPDFSAMDSIMSAGLDESGAVAVPTFAHWVSTVQRDEAQILKQQRLWHEEYGFKGKGGDYGGGSPSEGGGRGSGEGGRGRGSGDGGRGRGRGRKQGGGESPAGDAHA